MKAYDEDAKYILFINKSITILGCSTVNSLTIDFWDIFPNKKQEENLILTWAKLKAWLFKDRMGGEALTTALCAPTVMLGTGGEPRPNMSKVEGLII